MSAIKKKTYHPKNRIKRAVFKGAPSLFTTSDLNRQIEALQEQMTSLERRMGFPHTCTLSVEYKDSKATLTLGGGKLRCFGGEFDVNNVSLEVTLASAEYTGDLFIQGSLTEHLVDYGDLDNTSEISGAFFEDGTSKPAATHIVFDNAVTISTSFSEDPQKVTLFRVFFEGNKTPRVYNYGAWSGSFSSDAVSYTGVSPIQQKQEEVEKDLLLTKKAIKSFNAIEEGWRRLDHTFVIPREAVPNGIHPSLRVFNYYIRRYADILYVLAKAELTKVNETPSWTNGVFIGGLLDDLSSSLNYRSDTIPQVWNFFDGIPVSSSRLLNRINLIEGWRVEMIVPLHFIDVYIKTSKEVPVVPGWEGGPMNSISSTVKGVFSYGIIKIENSSVNGQIGTHYAIGGFFIDFGVPNWSDHYGRSIVKLWEDMGNPEVTIYLPGFQFILPTREATEDNRPENKF